MGNSNTTLEKKTVCERQITRKGKSDRFRAIFDRIREGKDNIDQRSFEVYFGAEYSQALWLYFTIGSTASTIDMDTFCTQMQHLMGMSTDIYVLIFGRKYEHPTDIDKISVRSFLKLCSIAAGIDADLDLNEFLNILVESIELNCSNVEDLVKWKHRICPNLCGGLQNKIRTLVTEEGDGSLETSTISDYGSEILNQLEMWFIHASIPSIYLPEQHWTPLYNSDKDGVSVNRFEKNVFGYRGPTVCILRLTDGKLFVVAIDQEWRSSIQMWGGINSWMAQLSPTFHVLPDIGGCVYCNLKTRGNIDGIRIGKDPREPILSVNADLSNLDAIETWGCSSNQTLKNQQKLKEWQNRQAEKNQKSKGSIAGKMGG